MIDIHKGEFPHQCEKEGCEEIVKFDDEPWCFTHSPDEGSFVAGYSAKLRQHPDFDPLKDYENCGPDGDYCQRSQTDGQTMYCANHYAQAASE